MIHCFEDVKLFQEKFSVPMPTQLSVLNDEAYNFRIGFLQEEKNEFIQSHQDKDYVGCIDALLDEVYVACGTSLMMGVDPELWNNTFIVITSLGHDKSNIHINTEEQYPRSPTFLPWDQYNQAISNLNVHLKNFVNNHYHKDITACTVNMCSLVSTCYDIALRMGLKYIVWAEMWADVQSCNLSKVRATSADQSKRKTSLDIIKPKNWQGPKGEEILTRHYPNWKDNFYK